MRVLSFGVADGLAHTSVSCPVSAILTLPTAAPTTARHLPPLRSDQSESRHNVAPASSSVNRAPSGIRPHAPLARYVQVPTHVLAVPAAPTSSPVHQVPFTQNCCDTLDTFPMLASISESCIINRGTIVSAIWFIITGLLLALFSTYVIVVWIRRRRYTKERFAFAALSAIVSLALFIFVLAVRSSTPWYILANVLNQLILRKPFDPPILTFADYALLSIVYVSVVFTAIYMFRNWDGLRSVSQHEMEQRHQDMSLPKEGLKELVRIIQREQLPLYVSESYKPTLQLGAPNEYVSWRDRARDLVQLKCSYYSFPQDNGWHEEARCWVGRNVNTGSLVLLRCTTDMLNQYQLRSFIAYSERMKSDLSKSNADLIVAIENDAVPANSPNVSDIRFRTETMLLDGLIDWTDYINDIRKRMSMTPLPDSNYTIGDVFVQPRFTPDGWTIDGPDDLESYLQQWLEAPGQRQLALLGDYGQGKSTAALAFAYKLTQLANPPRIPILIELRGTSPRNMTPLQLLAGWSSQYNINPKALLYKHMTGRLLLIFEGFDEMALVGDAEMRIKHFKTLWEFCGSKAKILITGRPNFFFDYEEMSVSLGITEPDRGSSLLPCDASKTI